MPSHELGLKKSLEPWNSALRKSSPAAQPCDCNSRTNRFCAGYIGSPKTSLFCLPDISGPAQQNRFLYLKRRNVCEGSLTIEDVEADRKTLEDVLSQKSIYQSYVISRLVKWRPCSMRRIRRPEVARSEEHTSELQSLAYLVCRLLLEKKKINNK